MTSRLFESKIVAEDCYSQQVKLCFIDKNMHVTKLQATELQAKT